MFDNLTPQPQQPQFPLPELDRAIEALIEFRNAFDEHGEPAEDDDPPEHDGTQGDQAWVEWTSMRGPSKRSPNFTLREEDDEDADAGEDDDGGGDCTEDEPGFDRISRAQANVFAHLPGSVSGAGCIINGDRELNGDEGDYGGEVDGV